MRKIRMVLVKVSLLISLVCLSNTGFAADKRAEAITLMAKKRTTQDRSKSSCHCSRGPRGPRGHMGKQGIQGRPGTLSTVYAHVFNADGEGFTVTTDSNGNLPFNTNGPISSTGISHSTTTKPADIIINKPGTYLVSLFLQFPAFQGQSSPISFQFELDGSIVPTASSTYSESTGNDVFDTGSFSAQALITVPTGSHILHLRSPAGMTVGRPGFNGTINSSLTIVLIAP